MIEAGDAGRLDPVGPSALAMGVFDGVHRGHQHIAAAVRKAAREHRAASVALVFDPHPDELFRPGASVSRLTPPAETLARLAAAGIERVVPVRFDHALRSLEPEAFLDLIGRAIELRALIMTPESAFGRGRSGTVSRMRELGPARGFVVVEVDPLLDGGKPISSSRIREAIAAADLTEATRLLGRTPFLAGTVVHGDRRGRELGFPTANLAFDYAPALPPLGIYTGRVSVPERDVGPDHPALVSVGVRPTFHNDGRVLVEVYLLDWDGDLYDAMLRLDLLERLRDERRFADVPSLVAQMRDDEAEARRRLSLDGG